MPLLLGRITLKSLFLIDLNNRLIHDFLLTDGFISPAVILIEVRRDKDEEDETEDVDGVEAEMRSLFEDEADDWPTPFDKRLL